mmetsp:Transcript_27765/g.58978  ORF Transcript_27765/g.58978 Transcript_27765/m.58978 type:complete len:288 (-) Transcript_27765:132-995(-)
MFPIAGQDNMVDLVKDLFEATSSERLSSIGKLYHEQYATNTPFPHITIDNFLPKRYLMEVAREHPESDVVNGCVDPQKCFKKTRERNKSYIDDEMDMGMYTRLLFHVMKSSTVVRFLEELSGIQNIFPDPHFYGSGLHFTDGDGGKLDIHADFNILMAYKFDRRVNAFIYLNDDWHDEYGGHLELWSKDMKSCMKRIGTRLGRLVVFSSTDFSYHGHPVPMTAPKGRIRRSIALYYYSNGRPDEECLGGSCAGNRRSYTMWQQPIGCEKCEQPQCKKYNDNETIPLL